MSDQAQRLKYNASQGTGRFELFDPEPRNHHSALYLVDPNGAAFNISCWNEEGVDNARGEWMRDTLNAALSDGSGGIDADWMSEVTAADREVFIANVRDLVGVSADFEQAVRFGASDCAPGLIAIANHRCSSKSGGVECFDAWLQGYVGEQDAATMRFSAAELRIAFEAGALATPATPA